MNTIQTDETPPMDPFPPIELLFSPSTLTFFDRSLWPHDLPADALPITPEQHKAVLDQLSEGLVLAATPDGQPLAVEPPPPSEADLASRARSQRDGRIEAVQWIVQRHQSEMALALATTLDAAAYLELQQYVQQLRDVPSQAGFPLSIDWPPPPAIID